MYLKRLELHGFKSFADKVNIEFKEGITGIVGPNGCGKSNISDAIRWVLGEQSVKSLRGSSMSDVIFAGSQDRKAQNLAEVTLIFDNSDRRVNMAYNEIEITRRIYRQNGEAEYLLNKEHCRLKDITDILLDTGLGKDSLSIISQGNIASFAESKPLERRGIFEEAAGVSKYKRRKIEAIRKLERTSENLVRIGDIVAELEKQIGPLKRQKDKAEKYLLLKESLSNIEISLLAQEIKDIDSQLKDIKHNIDKYSEQNELFDSKVVINERQNDEIKEHIFKLDKEINDLQTKYLEAIDQVTSLEGARQETELKRKSIIESGDSSSLKERIESLKAQINDRVNEYNDRVTRYKQGKEEFNTLKVKLETLNESLKEEKNDFDSLNNQLSQRKSQYRLLQSQLESNNYYNHGVKTIVDYFSNDPAIVGVVDQLLDITEGYDRAVAVALGGSSQYIVTKTDDDAKRGINFLKANKAGRATFLPCNVIKPRYIRDEHLLICNNTKGFLGLAKDFVYSEKDINNIIDNLLGNIIIADNLDNANNLARVTFNRYRVVTLEGDVINVGGSLTGGAKERVRLASASKQELERLQDIIVKQERELGQVRNSINQKELKIRDINNELFEKQMSIGRIEAVMNTKKESLLKYKAEYESLTDQTVELEDISSGQKEDRLLNELNEIMSLRDSLSDRIRVKRTERMNYTNQSKQIDINLKELRADYREASNLLNEQVVIQTKLDTQINIYLNRLNEEYKMTFEFAQTNYKEVADIESARNEVRELRKQIDALGNVNLDAIEEYQDVSSRYETMDQQRLDLIQAQEAILKAIKDMDKIMVKQFSETFEAINREFNNVFRILFGGGSAKISYTDPDNILETGIDIDVQPPGKSVQNISLFSGGEKALIAISCLFAILKVKPVPMVILDEVEAALDLANVERFAKYLREFAGQTQFIVVTHREGTMAECDLLYGATMQQKGVTKLVSVKLEDAVELSEAN